VYYPRQWGFETYLYPFFKQIKERILYEQSVLKIDPIKKLVLTSTHIIHYTTLVSTIPLPILLSLVWHKDKENYPLEYLSLCICSFLFPKSWKLDKQRIYSADPKYLFHKCAINSNSNLTMKRSPHCVISFEISYKQQSYTDTIYLNNCKKFLSFLGYSTDMILQQECRHFTYAYPIQTVGLETYRDTLSQQLVNNDIYLLGRCWNWEYLNFDSILEKTSHLYSSLNP
jgi:hypothetical protein